MEILDGRNREGGDAGLMTNTDIDVYKRQVLVTPQLDFNGCDGGRGVTAGTTALDASI